MVHRSTSTLRIGFFAMILALFVSAALAPGAMAQGGGAPAPLSSDDVPDEEIESAAEIVVALQMQQQQMQQEMLQKYGNPQEMDSTQRRKAQREIQSKQQALMQKETNEHDLDAQRLNMIMTSAQQDSTLRERMRTAVEGLRQEKMSQQQGGNEGDTGNPDGNDR